MRRTLTDRYNELGQRYVELERTVSTLERENINLKHELQRRLDTSMIQQRVQLASNLGHMVEAVSKAIVAVIAKETL